MAVLAQRTSFQLANPAPLAVPVGFDSENAPRFDFQLTAGHAFRFVQMNGQIEADLPADAGLIDLLAFGLIVLSKQTGLPVLAYPTNATCGLRLGLNGVYFHVEDSGLIHWNDFNNALSGGVSVLLQADLKNNDAVARNINMQLAFVLEIWSL